MSGILALVSFKLKVHLHWKRFPLLLTDYISRIINGLHIFFTRPPFFFLPMCGKFYFSQQFIACKLYCK